MFNNNTKGELQCYLTLMLYLECLDKPTFYISLGGIILGGSYAV